MSGPLRLHKPSSQALPPFLEGSPISADTRACVIVIKLLQLQSIDGYDNWPGFDSTIPVGTLELAAVRPHRGIRHLHHQKGAQLRCSGIQYLPYVWKLFILSQTAGCA